MDVCKRNAQKKISIVRHDSTSHTTFRLNMKRRHLQTNNEESRLASTPSPPFKKKNQSLGMTALHTPRSA